MTGSRDLRTLALLGLVAAAVLAVLGAAGSYLDTRERAARESDGPAPAGWMVDDLLAEARQITREAAPDGPGPW